MAKINDLQYISWPKVAGIGNVMRYDYEHIAHGVLWRVVRDELNEVLMRIQGIDPNDPPELVGSVFQRSLERYGRVITPSLVMARLPEILVTTARLGQSIDGSNLVEGRIKTMASLRAAQMIGCPF
jgi:hypothetical protein